MIRFAPFGLFLLFFLVFLRSLAPSITLGDSGDLVVSALSLFNTHPPGYPLNSLAGKLFSIIPVGSEPFRVGLFSAACGSLAVLALWFFAVEVIGGGGLGAYIAATAGAAVLAFSRTFWWQSAVPDKYSMAAALFAWAALALFRAAGPAGTRAFLLSSLMTGLALAHHPTGIILLPLFAFAWWRNRGIRRFSLAALLFLLPLCVKVVYPPVRNVPEAEVAWGYPDRAARLWNYLSAERYIGKLAALDSKAPAIVGKFVDHAFAMPWREFGGTFLFAVAGFVVLYRNARRTAVWLGTALLGNLVFGLLCRTPETERFYLPAFWIAACLASVGVYHGWARWKPVAAVAGVLLVLEAWNSAGYGVRSRDYGAPDHVRNMAYLLPSDCIVLGWGDVHLLPLMARGCFWGSSAKILLIPAEDLMLGSPGRKKVASVLGAKEHDISGYQESPALAWEASRLAKPKSLFLTSDSLPGMIPSRGLARHGLLLRVTGPENPLTIDEQGWEIMRSLRLRSLLKRHGSFEGLLAESYGREFIDYGDFALSSGSAAVAVEMGRRGLRMARGLPQLHEFAARAAFKTGDLRTARAEWGEALMLTNGRYVEPYIGRAQAARAEGDWESALANARFAALYAVGSANPLLAAAEQYAEEGKKEKALDTFMKAAAGALVSRGMAEFNSGRLISAAKSWEAAGALAPGSPRVFANLGALAAFEERFETAAELFRKALGLSPDSTEARDIRDNLDRALEAVAWRARLPELKRAVRSQGDSPGLLCDLGNAYWYMGRTRIAEGLYRRALGIDRTYVRAWGNLGSALAQQGRAAEAIKIYEQALRVRPDYVEAMINLGAVYQGLGEDQKAEKWIRRALVLNPDHPQALSILALLRGSRR